jgi:Flp pilus assembly protein TadG
MRLCRIRTERAGDKERGAALVEFALVLPLVVSLILGMVSGGAAYNRKVSMSGSVREGSRFGATLDGSASWATYVQTRTAELSANDLTTNQVCVALINAATTATVYSASGSGCSSVTAPSTPTTATTGCVVKIWAARPDQLQALFFTANLTLTTKTVARYEGSATGC